jgi:hypothetical protein
MPITAATALILIPYVTRLYRREMPSSRKRITQVSRVPGMLLQVHTQKGGKVYLPIGVDRVEPWLLDGLNVPPLLSTIFTGQPLDLLSYYSGPQVRASGGCAEAGVHCPVSASAAGREYQRLLQAGLAPDCTEGIGCAVQRACTVLACWRHLPAAAGAPACSLRPVASSGCAGMHSIPSHASSTMCIITPCWAWFRTTPQHPRQMPASTLLPLPHATC